MPLDLGKCPEDKTSDFHQRMMGSHSGGRTWRRRRTSGSVSFLSGCFLRILCGSVVEHITLICYVAIKQMDLTVRKIRVTWVVCHHADGRPLFVQVRQQFHCPSSAKTPSELISLYFRAYEFHVSGMKILPLIAVVQVLNVVVFAGFNGSYFWESHITFW
jgi:hypothetical protein